MCGTIFYYKLDEKDFDMGFTFKKAYRRAKKLNKGQSEMVCIIAKSPYNNEDYIVKCEPATLVLARSSLHSSSMAKEKVYGRNSY